MRTDGFGYVGYKTSTAFDSLLAKVIVHSKGDDFATAVNCAARALSEFRIEGGGNNIAFVQNILAHSDFVESQVHTRWVEQHMSKLVASSSNNPKRYVEGSSIIDTESHNPTNGYAGARVDMSDPLALFDHDAKVKAHENTDADEPQDKEAKGPDGTIGMSSPIQGTIVSVSVSVGEEVHEGQALAVVEAMKMEHVIASNTDGIVREISMGAGDIVLDGFAFVFIEEAEVASNETTSVEEIDLDYIRPDLHLSLIHI